jgi:hypothetical protein
VAPAAYDPALVSGDPLIGRAVWLSGMPGLPEGVYTVLPGRYATVPGAYRVVQDTRVIDAVVDRNLVLPDGSQLMAGHFVDTLDGSRDARSTRFLVQSGEVWQQYSQYELASANEFFTRAAEDTAAQSRLPADAGQLTLAASRSLNLAARLLTDAASGGAGALVDISARQLQIVDAAAEALPGYVQVRAADLVALDAASLLIGGTRSRTAEGDVISAAARNVVVSNTSDVLRAPELLLVAAASAAGDGIVVDSGALLEADGERSEGRVPDLLIGRAAQGSQPGVSGDGALLRLANSAANRIIRRNVPGSAGVAGTARGTLLIGEGASLRASGSLILDAAASTVVAPTAVLAAREIDANSSRISFLGEGYAGETPDGLVIGAATLAQLAGANSVRLSSRGDMDFLGGIDIGFDGALSLSAGRLRSDGADVSIRADALRIENALAAPAAAAQNGPAALRLSGETVGIGDGLKRLDGFATVDIAADQAVILDGNGVLDAGDALLTLQAPLLVGENAAVSEILTSGLLRLQTVAGATAPTQAPDWGASITLRAARVEADTAIVARGGRIAIESTLDDIVFGDAARLDVSGLDLPFFDVKRSVSGGEILLQAAQGDVIGTAATRFVFGGGAEGGNAGRLDIATPAGAIRLPGQFDARAAAGQRGGSVRLQSLAALDLDALAPRLLDAGANGRLELRTQQGELHLRAGSVLRASEVILAADSASDGRVRIDGLIDASGASGGEILLAGRDGVLVSGSLLARAEASDGEGGSVRLFTAGAASGDLHAQSGYRLVSADDAGEIRLADSAHIDVSGSTAGGIVHLRAPLLADGELPVYIAAGARIDGTRQFDLEAYASWATSDASQGALRFDGLIDPAGLFNGNGASSAGGNAAHRDFYQQTLMRFVQQPGFAFEQRFEDLPGLRIRPGIELINDDSARLGGDVRVLSDWNLGAGRRDTDGRLQLDYRYRGDIAPLLTLRAVGDLNLRASLSDGFFQYNNPFSAAQAANVDNSASPLRNSNNPLPLLSAGLAMTLEQGPEGARFVGVDSSSYRLVAGADASSADPLATVAAADGSVYLDGFTSTTYRRRNGSNATVVAPTMVRTGVGSIEVVAAADVAMRDTTAPGVIYTAGRPVAGTLATPLSAVLEGGSGLPVVVDSGAARSEGAGDILIRAGRDVSGVQRVIDDGSRGGRAGANLTQYWWPWMQDPCWFSGNCSAPAGSRISFGIFGQGVLSVGGDIRVAAGRDLRELSASAPVSWRRSGSGESAVVEVFGGGDIELSAGRDILSGTVFLARGVGRVEAGRDIRAGLTAANGSPLGTLFALQDGQLAVRAGRDVLLGGVLNPSWMFRNFDNRAYSSASALRVVSERGALALARAPAEFAFGARTGLSPAYGFVLPATLELEALGGAIRIDTNGELFPAPLGQLSLIARDDIRLANGNISGTRFGLIDALASRLPSELNPRFGQPLASSFIVAGVTSAVDLHDPLGLHRFDSEPVRIYSAEGSILNGQGSGLGAMIIDLPKPALIAAGRDIVDLSLRGQHLYASDITRITAGRDIYNTPLAPQRSVAFIELGGLGTLVLQAGRNIGPLTSANDALALGYLRPTGAQYPGIRSVGNQNNLWLPREGAAILIGFGTGPGNALDAFAQAYIAPSVYHNPDDPADPLGTADYSKALLAFVRRYESDRYRREGIDAPLADLDADGAWAIFQTLPEYQRQRLVYDVFLDILDRTGLDFNDPESRFAQQYARGFAAIEALFPAALGYTRNARGEVGGTQQVRTGTLDMRGSTIQTQRGGDILMVGPGGDIIVGSASAPPLVPASAQTAGIGPNNQGILVLEQGRIGVFTDRNVLLAQSRIFTEQGGDLLIWSSNGDINAGKGAKTSSEIPPPAFLCDIDQFCVTDARSQVSGAGIAVLQTLAGQPSGTANLVAPGGTVDAGDAGIRVSGSLNVAALQVANADNIAVSGNASGVPSAAVDTGALGAASSVSASASQTAVQSSGGNARREEKPVLMVRVEVLGFGGAPDEEEE